MQHSNTPPKWKQLTGIDIRQFIEQGYILVRKAFPRELAERVIPMVWAELGVNPDDPPAWASPMVILKKVLEEEPFPQIHSRRYIGAIDDLCGSGRWNATRGVGHWPIRLPGFASPPWRLPKEGWHVDGNSDRHRLNSPDLGLLNIELFTDIEPGGGGTAVRVGSHRYAARIFAEAEPDGLTLRELSLRAAAATEHLPAVEVSGQAGDVIIMHPLTVHAPSPNTSDRARIAAVKLVRLYEPMNLTRRDTTDYSPVERAIVDALAENVNI
ncbi:MAG: phytanoyl-CoA dioxygenase family protein [Thermodesulfobacteriota bacterium]